MLPTEEIMRYFSFYTDLEGEALTRWLPLCAAAGSTLEKRLRPEAASPLGVDLTRLCIAAGGIACADYLAGSSGGGERIRVGDLSLEPVGQDILRDAADLRDYHLTQVADLLLPRACPLLLVQP